MTATVLAACAVVLVRLVSTLHAQGTGEGEIPDGQALTVLPPVSDLALTLSDSPDPVAVSNTLTYTITLLNRGPSHAAQAEHGHPRGRQACDAFFPDQ